MCGIWGYIGRKIDIRLTSKAFNRIKHRGPDNSVLHSIPNIGLIGFHRLSIINNTHLGNQPFINKNKKSAVYTVCNGEIYNHKKLVHNNIRSDCYAIHHLYNKRLNPYEHIQGEYAYSIIDVKKDNTYNLQLANDHLGIRPLFYAINEQGIGWSSEVKGLLDIFPAEYIKRFPPGSYLNFNRNNNNLTPIPYTNLNNPIRITNPHEAISKTKHTLINCVKEMMISDRPIGCLLSGGLDSSIISTLVSIELKKKGQRLNTFSVGIEGSTDEYYAKQVAHHIGSKHKHFTFTPQEFLNAIPEVINAIESYDTTTVRASVGQYLVTKKIKETTDIKVLFVGDGSDELCSGYIYSHNAPNDIELHNDAQRLLSQIHTYDVLRADRGVASHGLETRVPFLHKDFVDLILSIAPRLRNPNFSSPPIEKWLLRKAFENYLPYYITWRKKEAFSDGVSSVDNSWYTIIQNSLNHTNFDITLLSLSNPPQTLEAMYYRAIFRELYPRCDHLIPGYWLPKWSGETTEPSARVLTNY